MLCCLHPERVMAYIVETWSKINWYDSEQCVCKDLYFFYVSTKPRFLIGLVHVLCPHKYVKKMIYRPIPPAPPVTSNGYLYLPSQPTCSTRNITWLPLKSNVHVLLKFSAWPLYVTSANSRHSWRRHQGCSIR